MAQLKGDSCDDYIDKILRLAILLAMPHEQSLHAIINGLQPSIQDVRFTPKRYNIGRAAKGRQIGRRYRNAIHVNGHRNHCYVVRNEETAASSGDSNKHQQPLQSTPGTVQSAPSITLVNHHPLVELRSLTTIARRLLQQDIAAAAARLHKLQSTSRSLQPLLCSTSEWTER